MMILGIESSAGPASCALYDGDAVIAEAFANNGLTHSKTLMPMIENTMALAGVSIGDVDLIAVSAGPGSFTGLRIGVSIAKGLAWAGDIRCAGVSTLEAMACGISFLDSSVCSVMDARRKQVYNAMFDIVGGRTARITDDRAISLEELSDEIEKSEKKYILVGDGTELCYNYLKNRGIAVEKAPPEMVFQRARGVVMLGAQAYKDGKTVSASELRPVYIRLPQAERELNEKRKPAE